jgi:CDI immunity proteins
MHDQSKSIEQLEQDVWNHNDFQSHVVQESQRLRRIPLRELKTEDLRLLITQRIGLQFSVPLALEILATAPLRR